MKKIKSNVIVPILLIVLGAAIITAAFFTYKNLVRLSSVYEGQTVKAQAKADELKELPLAADFSVINMNGNTVRLSDFEGKPIVMNFWATWCPPCKAELAAFEHYYSVYGDKVQFLMVNLTDGGRDTVKGVKEFVKENKFTFPVFFDTKHSATYAYRINSIPVTAFVNKEGFITYGQIGQISESILEAKIEEILKN